MERNKSNYLFKIIFYLIFISISVLSAPIQEENEIMDYLSKYGYLPDNFKNTAMSTSEKSTMMRNAMKDFQSFAGIKVTGNMDKETKSMMNMPRCGMRDKIIDKKSKRYAQQGSHWNKRKITYKIKNYSKNLTESEVNSEIAKAFGLWSLYAEIVFEETKNDIADITISFEVGDHGDNNDFDGPGKDIAHADYPKRNAVTHFDDEENWTIRNKSGINLLQNAAHEFGHNLGLGHSNVKSSVMYSFFIGYDPKFEYELDKDDILGIQSIYQHELCKFDTIFTTQFGDIYIFKGDYFWKVEGKKLAVGYPRKISTKWKELPGNIDAAFSLGARTYFFKGSKFWKYYETKLDRNISRDINTSFPGIPNNIDTVLNLNRTLYFFKGSHYWIHQKNKNKNQTEYNGTIADFWKGADYLNATFEYDNSIYLFKDEFFVKYDCVRKSHIGEPKSWADLFGCRKYSGLEKLNDENNFQPSSAMKSRESMITLQISILLYFFKI